MTTRNGLTVGLSAVVAWAAVACADQSAKNQPPQRAQLALAVSSSDHRDAPEPLSPVARAVLKGRMASHARDMDKLVSAIMVLDYPGIAERANGIAADANLGRPLSGDATELNAGIPEKFFLRQDELKAGAKELGVAASALDPYGVASAYGRVAEGCVRCHADYRPRG